ncbi:MAG: hypothetical protein AAB706_00575 [Patescibacteria group bacterium]
MRTKTQTKIKLEKEIGEIVSKDIELVEIGDNEIKARIPDGKFVILQEKKAELSQHKADIKAFEDLIKNWLNEYCSHGKDNCLKCIKELKEGLKKI